MQYIIALLLVIISLFSGRSPPITKEKTDFKLTPSNKSEEKT